LKEAIDLASTLSKTSGTMDLGPNRLSRLGVRGAWSGDFVRPV